MRPAPGDVSPLGRIVGRVASRCGAGSSAFAVARGIAFPASVKWGASGAHLLAGRDSEYRIPQIRGSGVPLSLRERAGERAVCHVLCVLSRPTAGPFALYKWAIAESFLRGQEVSRFPRKNGMCLNEIGV
jgi:hypothetical protein